MRYNCRDCDWSIEFYGMAISKVLEHEKTHKKSKKEWESI